jgi:hypothetical protein
MQPKRSLIYILAALIALPLFGTGASATTIEVIQTFDFPGSTATLPQKISDQKDLTGTTITTNGKTRAFIYKVLIHKFSPPLVPDFAGGSATQGRGINNRRHIVGEYLNASDGTFHGYLMTHPNCADTGPDMICPLIYDPLDVAGASNTIPLGINNFGDIVGTAIFSNGTQTAFISVNQVVTTFAVPGATATFAYQVNSTNQIVGYYTDSSGVPHGYTRDSAGVLTFPIDVPGAAGTLLLGNNDSNWGVGRYTGASGVTHGFFYIASDNIQTYDYPGATYTSLNGINKDGLICGYYNDAAGVSRGLVLRLNADVTPTPTPTPTSTPTDNPPVGIAEPAL